MILDWLLAFDVCYYMYFDITLLAMCFNFVIQVGYFYRQYKYLNCKQGYIEHFDIIRLQSQYHCSSIMNSAH